MNNTLRKFILTLGAVLLVSFAARDVLAQLPSGIGGPYTVDSATVALLHFDGADSAKVMSASSIPTIDTAQVWQERAGTVYFPDNKSPLPGFGGSVFLAQNDHDVNNNIYNFLLVENKNDVFDLPNSFTLETWFNVADSGQAERRMKLLFKPGDDPVMDVHIFYLNNFATDIFEESGSMYAKSAFNTIDHGRFMPYGGNPLEMSNFGGKRGEWFHYSTVKDDEDSTFTTAVYRVDGTLVVSYQMDWKGEDYGLIADTANSGPLSHMYVGINPRWNVGNNNWPPPTWGGAAETQFYGNFDEIRVSNVARELVVPIFSKGSPNMWDKGLSSPQADSQSFALNVNWNDIHQDSTHLTFHYNWGEGWNSKQMNHVDTTRYKVTTPNGPGGTTYQYYVTAHAEGEEKGRYPYKDEIAEFDIQFLPGTTLKLSFEEGDDNVAPVDSSRFNYVVDIIGDTTYNGEQIDGTFSYELGPNSDLAAMDAPATSSFSVTASMWFKATSMPSNTARLLAHENPDDSTVVNYEIFFRDSSLHARGTGAGEVELDDYNITTGEWYRVTYMISESAHSLQLWDQSGNLITHDVEEVNGRPAKDQDGTLYIGQGNFNPDSAFSGLVDKIEIVNYPAETGPFIAQNVTQYISIPDTVEEYPINVHIPHAGEGTVDARLHYKGQFGWTFLEMSKEEGSAWYSKAITKQAAKTSVPYFVTVEEGPYSATLPMGAAESDTTDNYDFAVYGLHNKVLDVDFEDFVQDTNVTIPKDKSSYSQFVETSVHGVSMNNLPIKSSDAAEGNYSFKFTREDTSYVAFDSDFLSTDEVTMTFWFKPTSFDPEHGGGYPYYRTIQMVTKNTGDYYMSDAAYNVGIQNERYSGQPRTIVGRAMTESSDTRAIHDGLDMDSTVMAGNWYQVHFEYSIDDTAFTKLMDASGNVIEEVGMETSDYGTMVKNNLPLTVGAHWTGSGQETWRPNFYSGHIDDVQIYNYAATAKPPQVSDVTDHDSINVAGDPQTVSAAVERNGDEDVYLVWRVQSSGGTTAWDSTMMEVDFTGTNYSAELPMQDAGKAIEYFAATRNDFGVTSSSDTERATFHRARAGERLVLDFESGEGSVVDSSPMNWTVKRAGKLASSPFYTRDAVEGKYALQFQAEDSTYLKIDAPYPFLNHESFQLDLWFKSHREANTNVRLLGKPGTDADGLSWWQQNFELKGIGGGSWTAGGYINDTTITDFGNRFIVNHIDDSTAFGSEQVKAQLEDSTWYHFRYLQDVGQDSVHAAITTADGQTVAVTSMKLMGDMNIAPVMTSGPFTIGHAGPEGEPYFDGVIDHVRITTDIPGTITDVPSGKGNDLPDKFSLKDNYPNPFNPTTTIEYALPKSTDVTLKVYNLLGREVATLVNSKQQAGRHQVKFDAGSLASGVYFYRITTPEFNKVRKMMLIK